MSFLLPFLKDRDTKSNMEDSSPTSPQGTSDAVSSMYDSDVIQNSEGSEENESAVNNKPKLPSSRMMPPPLKARKKFQTDTASSVLMKYLLKSEKHEKSTSAHPIDAFFAGLAATVKTFSPEYQHMAKSKLFAAVSELEWAQLQMHQTKPASISPTASSTPSTFPREALPFIRSPSPLTSSAESSAQSYCQNFNP